MYDVNKKLHGEINNKKKRNKDNGNLWRIFFCKSPYSVQIQENIDQKKLRIWTLFTQWVTPEYSLANVFMARINSIVAFRACMSIAESKGSFLSRITLADTVLPFPNFLLEPRRFLQTINSKEKA